MRRSNVLEGRFCTAALLGAGSTGRRQFRVDGPTIQEDHPLLTSPSAVSASFSCSCYNIMFNNLS